MSGMVGVTAASGRPRLDKLISLTVELENLASFNSQISKTFCFIDKVQLVESFVGIGFD